MDVKRNRKKLIILSGGGTGGPSTVPLALAQACQQIEENISFVFIGSNPDLEKKLFADLFKKLDIDYRSLPAGKWRRYFSLNNFFDLFKIIYSFFKSLFLLIKLHPDMIVSAGSFASVPLVWAGKVLGVKIMVHQQDLRAGLANRLMAPVANIISVAFEKSLEDYGPQAIWIGNPYLDDAKNSSVKEPETHNETPLLFLSGGGSGSLALNRLLIEALPYIPTTWQIVHQTGRGKNTAQIERVNYLAVENFSHGEFFNNSHKADIIISRAGLGSLTEFSYLAKTLILIPMPRSHQEDNARYFADKEAAIYLHQEELSGRKLADIVLSLWENKERRKSLEKNIKEIMPIDAALSGAKIIHKTLYESA